MNTLIGLRKSSLIALLILLLAGGGASIAKKNEVPGGDTGEGDLPRIENAKVERSDVTGTLADIMADLEKNATSPVWVGFLMPAVAGQRTTCCGNDSDSSAPWCGKCLLETDREERSGQKAGHGGISDHKDRDSGANQGIVRLEGRQRLIVFFRLQDKHLTRMAVASEECVLDAGGLPFIWLMGVKTPDSVAFLSGDVREGFTNGGEKHSIGNEALTAIALHDGPEAEAALESRFP